jgi:hypothetical protein
MPALQLAGTAGAGHRRQPGFGRAMTRAMGDVGREGRRDAQAEELAAAREPPLCSVGSRSNHRIHVDQAV